MARVGRKRRMVEREPNGRAKRTYENPRQQVAMQPHRILIPKEHRENAEGESEFGRLLCHGRVTRAQYEAGKMYLALASHYRAVMGYPPLHPQAIDLSSVRGGQGRETPSHIVRSVTDRYNDAFNSICGQRAQKMIADCVVREMKISDFDGLKYLTCGLDNLVKHFGLDPAMQISKSSM